MTLDDDVAVALERLRRSRGGRLKSLVNEVLREGLKHMRARPTRAERFETNAVDLGRSRVSSVDDVTEVLAASEGEAFR